MIGRLFDWYIERKVRSERANLPAVDWTSLHASVAGPGAGYAVFVEMRDGRLASTDDPRLEAERGDIVGLAYTWLDDRPRGESEEPAQRLAQALAPRRDLLVSLYVNRSSIELFTGHYVSVRPLLH